MVVDASAVAAGAPRPCLGSGLSGVDPTLGLRGGVGEAYRTGRAARAPAVVERVGSGDAAPSLIRVATAEAARCRWNRRKWWRRERTHRRGREALGSRGGCRSGGAGGGAAAVARVVAEAARRRRWAGGVAAGERQGAGGENGTETD